MNANDPLNCSECRGQVRPEDKKYRTHSWERINSYLFKMNISDDANSFSHTRSGFSLFLPI